MSNSTCLRADLENSNIGSVNKSQAPSKKKPDGGLNEAAYSKPKEHKSITLFRALRVHSKHEGANMKCKPNCPPGGTLSKTRLASCSGGIHWRILASRSGSTLAGYTAGSTGKGFSAQRDPLASFSAILSGTLGGIHWRAALVGYSAGCTGEPLWRDTRRDPLASHSGMLSGMLRRIHWRADSAGSTGEPLWRDTWRVFKCRTPSKVKIA